MMLPTDELLLGVSMGEMDLIQEVLRKLKATIHFGRVLMKPGKPLTFATLEREGRSPALIFGLPGNPVSAICTYYLVCLPTLRRMAGFSNPHLPEVRCVLQEALTLDPERPEYHRVRVQRGAHIDKETSLVALSSGRQASSRLLSMRANALARLPQRSGQLEPGTTLDAILFGRLQ